MISLGNDAFRAVSVGDAACVGVYVGDAMVFPDAPNYDETKIAVIELDDNDESTGNVEYFDTPADAKTYMYNNYGGSKRYELRFGKNIETQHTVTPGFLASFPGIVKFTVYSGLLRFESGMLTSCSNLKEVYTENVPFTISGYGEPSGVFAGSTALEKVTICGDPEYTNYSVNNTCFGGCTGLKDLEITVGVESIGSEFATTLAALENVKITNAHYIGYKSFDGLTNLKTAHLEWTDDAIGQEMFDGCSALESLTGSFPTGIRNFNDYIFRGCSALEFGDLEITNDSTSGAITINNGAFKDCSGITSLTINDTSGYQVNINDDAFNGCDGMESATITASGAIHMRERNFAGCTALRTVTLTSGTGIHDGFYANTFDGCDDIIITINAPENSISGAPWGATDATVIWTG